MSAHTGEVRWDKNRIISMELMKYAISNKRGAADSSPDDEVAEGPRVCSREQRRLALHKLTLERTPVRVSFSHSIEVIVLATSDEHPIVNILR
jgi:hypothetical protein